MCARFMCPQRKVPRPLTSCHAQGSKPTWDESKKLLTDTKFLESLETYDKENIPDKTIKQLQKYINNPDFVPEKVKKVSTAATSLCMWVRAMDVYNRVAKNVEPKKKALKAAEDSVAEMSALLATKQAELKEVTCSTASTPCAAHDCCHRCLLFHMTAAIVVYRSA